MAVTPEQLRNHLVSYYTETWRSNGVPVTVSEMYSGDSSSDTQEPREQGDQTATPQDEAHISFLSLRNSKMLLRVRCDDSAPKDSGLRARFADLQAFMKNNPALVAKTKALVDQEIERDYLVELYDTMPVVTMSMADEVSDYQDMINLSSLAQRLLLTTSQLKLLARHRLLSEDEPLHPDTPAPINLQFRLLTIDSKNKPTFLAHKYTTAITRGSEAQFFNWLNHIDGQDGSARSSQVPDYMIDEVYRPFNFKSDAENKTRAANLREMAAKRDKWLYRGATFKPLRLIGKWQSLET